MRWFQAATCHFRQHRRKEEGICLAYNGQRHRGIGVKQMLYLFGSRDAYKPSADDDDTCLNHSRR